MIYDNLPKSIDGLGLEKFPLLYGEKEQVMYGYNHYTSYFNFEVDWEDNSICAMVYDHDEGGCSGFETLFSYEGDKFDEWFGSKEEFEQHQKEWEIWKAFVEMYNSN